MIQVNQVVLFGLGTGKAGPDALVTSGLFVIKKTVRTPDAAEHGLPIADKISTVSAGWPAGHQGRIVMVSKAQVLDSLRKVYDPEIGINIVDVGLVYRVEMVGDTLEVDFTLTSPGCPLADSIEADMRDQIKADHGIKDELIKTALVWDPPWTIEYMSEEARLDLGYPI